MTRVLVAANSAIAQAGLEVLLASNPSLTVISRTTTTATLNEQIESLQPDVLLLELELNEDDPLTGLPLFDDSVELPAIAVLAENGQSTWVGDLLRAGVRGVLPADAIASEIVAAVEAIANGLIAIHPDFLEALPIPTTSTLPRPNTPSPTLTPREVEVLEMLAEGLGNKAIARRLQISEHTVKFHISSLFSKLNASSRTEAVTLGARQGLIML